VIPAPSPAFATDERAAARISLWHLAATVALQLALAAIFWRGLSAWLAAHVVQPMGGWIDVTLVFSGGLFLVLVAVFAGWLGLRFEDVGLTRRGLPAGLLALLGGWAAIQLLCATPMLVGSPVRIARPEHPFSALFADLAGQLLGNALLEEFFYRGILFGQLLIALRARLPRLALSGSVLLSQGAFAAVHLPSFRAQGGALRDAWWYFGLAFAIGCLFCLLYSRSRNLWICIALHSLANWQGHWIKSPIQPYWAAIAVIALAALLWPRSDALGRAAR
jgi:membrane protease YdiL (CAAX protease family)